MARTRPILLAAFIAALVAGIAGCSGSSSPTSSNNGGNNTNGGGGTTVNIQGFAFSPATLTVPVGTTVTWTNNDATGHTVTSNGTPSFSSSGVISPNGGSFNATFSTAGTYAYHCSIHPTMTGRIVVTAQSTGGTGSTGTTGVTGGNGY